MLHVNISMLHVNINKLHANIIILHVDIIYFECKGQKFALPCLIIVFCLFVVVGFFLGGGGSLR